MNELETLLKNASNEPLVVDTLPYTDPTWCLTNLSSSNKSVGNEVYNTKKTLKIFEPRKIIANFNDVFNYKINRPVTNFSYLTGLNPTAVAISSIIFNGVIPGLSNFYETRATVNFIPTEGFVYGSTPTGYLSPRTTTSMLNTPYFVNAIQNGVDNSRVSGNTYPYTQAAYLFINSLPLATLREKYKTISDDDVVTELDYISSCFKKFGAIHKMPYAWVLKMGSLWYRYKTYKTTGIDFLETAWQNFDYKVNFDLNLKLLLDTDFYHRMRWNNGLPSIIPDVLVANRDHDNRISSQSTSQYDCVVEHPEGGWMMNSKEFKYIQEKYPEFIQNRKYPDEN